MVNLTGISELTNSIPDFSLSSFTLAEFIQTVKPLLIFIIGVTIYSIFIFKFYRFLARKDIVKFNWTKEQGFLGWIKKLGKSIIYLVENIILTPVCIFFWFAILSTFLLFLTKSGSVGSVILTSMALVSAVRITAYYNENLSQDLAKMVPFALLGIFLVDASYFSIGSIFEIAKQVPLFWSQLAYYLAFVIGLEISLRVLQTLVRIVMPVKEESSDQ